jgi:hypothetical protein
MNWVTGLQHGQTLLPKHPFGIIRSHEKVRVLRWIMSLAYRIVLECPNGHNINLQKKCGNVWLVNYNFASPNGPCHIVTARIV